MVVVHVPALPPQTGYPDAEPSEVRVAPTWVSMKDKSDAMPGKVSWLPEGDWEDLEAHTGVEPT
jgi:hypothetical protein